MSGIRDLPARPPPCQKGAHRPLGMARLASVGERLMTLDLLVEDHKIAPGWADALRAVAPDIDGKIEDCLTRLAAAGPYLPSENTIWRAFKVPPTGVRVLILGQDPYPNEEHAVGLSFSTGPEGPVPASLQNIYGELRRSGYEPGGDGDLSAWADRGVMLLNRALTVPRDPSTRPRRHFKWWAPIVIPTMKAIAVEAEKRSVAAMLWGVPAHRMRRYLGPNIEVFASSHPAQLSVNRTAGCEEPFRGSRPFARVNEWFVQRGDPEVDWNAR
ncbi:uracil-DNA glycosylase [Intrasporangium mesophilum]